LAISSFFKKKKKMMMMMMWNYALIFWQFDGRIIWELQHKFDDLPIHRIVYNQSYNQGLLQILIAARNMRSGQHQTLRSKLDPTGNQQDCLGMTPLHVLTCSSVHNLEVYSLTIENYPANLITKDMWGRCHCCMHFGELHLVRSYSFFLRAINHSTLLMYSIGQ
jgi:hypothetical protein